MLADVLDTDALRLIWDEYRHIVQDTVNQPSLAVLLVRREGTVTTWGWVSVGSCTRTRSTGSSRDRMVGGPPRRGGRATETREGDLTGKGDGDGDM